MCFLPYSRASTDHSPGPIQGQRQPQHRQCGRDSRIGRHRKGDPRLGARRHNSDRWRQIRYDQDAAHRPDSLRCRNCAGMRRAAQQGGADQHLLHQKPGARPGIREVREKPLHVYLLSAYGVRFRFERLQSVNGLLNFWGIYGSMVLRSSPRVTAWMQSFGSSFSMMLDDRQLVGAVCMAGSGMETS
jgi:hypothetical protein